MRERQPASLLSASTAQAWPDLSAYDLAPTLTALQLWSQVVGKVRLSLTPWENHSWHVPLYLTARGLWTGLIPAGARGLAVEFDLLHDALEICATDGGLARVPLAPGSVAAFYAATKQALASLGIAAEINVTPNEIADAVAFDEDLTHRAYDGAAARAYWRALVRIYPVFQLFRTRFLGKCSPIHLFWGSFDLAVTRFSGRPAPPHPGGAPNLPDAVMREAYSHEVSSAGFWSGPGSGLGPCFYSYAYPAPDGFGEAQVLPAAARFDADLGEFLLPYSAAAASADPDGDVLAFLQSVYVAAADLGRWDRARLERGDGPIGRPPAGS